MAKVKYWLSLTLMSNLHSDHCTSVTPLGTGSECRSPDQHTLTQRAKPSPLDREKKQCAWGQ